MQYLVGHLLSGEVLSFHEEVVRLLSREFKLPSVNDLIPPHLTLKAPFGAQDIKSLLRTVVASASSCRQTPLKFKGFGHFNRRVVFIDVEAPKQTYALIASLTKKLKRFPWLTFRPHDGAEHLHATLARIKEAHLFPRVWQYLSGWSPSFDARFDNLSILEKRGNKWSVIERFAIR